MTIVFWISAFAFVWIVVVFIRGEAAYRRFEATFPEPALDDHHITVWERLPLYDHEANGDFR